MENSNRLFRKAAFGGFNKEDVMRYIETMKTEFFDYKAQVEDTISDLNEKLSSLQQPEGESRQKEGVSAMSINEAADQLRQVADELLSNLNLLLGKLHLQDTTLPVCEDAPLSVQDETKEVTAQDKVDSLLRTLFSPAEDTLPQPAATQEKSEKPDVLSVLPHYLDA